jgi:hypothetical protein
VSELSPGTRMWNLARGALATRAIGIAADLHVADALADGPRPVAEIAAATGADADALHRILRALATEGVFAEEGPGVFRNTPMSELLRTGGGWDDFAHLFGNVWLRTAAALDASGEPSFPRIGGTDFWSWLADHPDERAAFDRAMALGDDDVGSLGELHWSDETVVDVGGGNGTLLLALLRRNPSLCGIVFDLPETRRDETAFGERCTFVEGSFFESVPRGDVHLLAKILHDWSDEDALRILRVVHAAGADGTRLVVLDSVIQPGNGPHGAKWLDLLMLSLLGGRERDERQWRELLAAGGFEPVRIEDGLIEARWR